ncbi:MAG: RidA family protein [Burkholderiales bacterium]|nr:RidA family protein [Burkholderiales bacterium]
MATTDDREALYGGRAWPDHYTFVPALRVADTTWISGTTASGTDGCIEHPGDIVEQTRQIFRKLERLLHAAGGTCDDIVSTTDFITTRENYRHTAAVRREFFKIGRPTSTGVLVAGLLREGAVIEISAVAVLRHAGRGSTEKRLDQTA